MKRPWKLARRLTLPSLALAAVGQPNAALGQQDTALPSPLTLEAAVNFALAHYPEIRAAIERRTTAAGNVSLMRTAYLPTANLLWQGNLATRNNVFGLLLPQPVVPAISGPVLPTTSNQGVWGSAAGILMAWEPLDFGYRSAAVDVARAGERAAAAEVDVSRLDVAGATASAFMSVIEAEQAIRAAQADVARREAFSRSVHVLVENQLRPGVDASRADAELAAARIALIQARITEKVARTALANLLGRPAEGVSLDAGPLVRGPPGMPPPAPNLAAHPVASAESSRVQAAGAQVRMLSRAYVPHFTVQSGLSARGTSANVDGSVAGGASGLGLQRANWAVGLTASFPLLDVFSIHAHQEIASANERAESARYQQILQALSAQAAAAQARLEGAIAIARTTPTELQAARDAEAQARARYAAALANVVEVTEAQDLLIRAEANDAVAALNAWRALAALAAAGGDLTPFLLALRNPAPGAR